MVQIRKPMIDDPVGENLRLVYGQPEGQGGAMPDRLSLLLEELRRQHVSRQAEPLRREGARRG